MILSGGEKQRMAWARLFLRRPRFGLLDEASAGVSVEVLEHLYETAASYDITLLTISHEPAGEPPAPTPSEDCHGPSRHGWGCPARHFVRSEELSSGCCCAVERFHSQTVELLGDGKWQLLQSAAEQGEEAPEPPAKAIATPGGTKYKAVD